MVQPVRRKCCVCGRDRDVDEMYLVHTTEKEREAIRAVKIEPQDSYAYCRPCWGVLADKEKAAQLYKGIVLTNFRHAGLPNVGQRHGQRVYEFLVGKARPKPS